MRDTPIYIAGLPIDTLDMNAAVLSIISDATARAPRVYAFINGHSAMLRRKSPAYAAVLSQPVVVNLADGAAIELGARLVGHGRIPRVPGPDFLEAVAQAMSLREDLSVFVLGGGEGVADAVACALAGSHPGLRIAGTGMPPFGEWTDAQSRTMIDEVRASGANLLLLGVSAPKQETWAAAHIEALGVPVACIGAAFDFAAGSKPRAPQWVRASRLEWLYRLVTEPRRLWHRYLVGNSVFIADTVRYWRRPAETRDARPKE